jgi:hypothetical protein
VQREDATWAILGALNWSAQWFSPKGEITVDELGREFADLFIHFTFAIGLRRGLPLMKPAAGVIASGVVSILGSLLSILLGLALILASVTLRSAPRLKAQSHRDQPSDGSHC